MAVESAEDFASYMDDWGESFEHRGSTVTGEFNEPSAEAFDARGRQPFVRMELAAAAGVAVGDTLVRVSTGQAYEVATRHVDDTTMTTPTVVVRLLEL